MHDDAKIEDRAATQMKWIGILAKAAELMVRLQMGNDVRLRAIWAHDDDYRFHGDASVRYLRLQLLSGVGKKRLTGYDLIPWTDFSPAGSGNASGPDGLPRVMAMSRVLTVTPYAVVYERPAPMVPNGREKALIDRFQQQFHVLIDVDRYTRMQDEALNWPEHVQVIDSNVYRCYVDVQVAVPGSRLPELGEWQSLCPGRMLHLQWIPDRGPVRNRWLPAVPHAENDLPDHLSLELLPLFTHAVDRALDDPGQARGVTARVQSKMRDFFDAADRGHALRPLYEDRLRRWLQQPPAPVVSPSERKIFGDYQPKTTPDTVADVAPAVAARFTDLPPADPGHLAELTRLFDRYRGAADDHPGQWIEGNPLLGAQPREYRPSPDELMLMEIGERIGDVIRRGDNDALSRITRVHGLEGKIMSYRRFRFMHMDVMGSGRFYYVEQIEDIRLELP